jgi:ADP-heptose:LPS heptosyltransferase
MEEMFSRFWEIYLFGSPGSIPMAVIPQPARSRVINLAHDKLTFRQSAAVAQTCDVIVAPDSALMHLAGTLGLPCVALFGPIPAALRTAYYPSVTALQDTSACPMAPCFHHPRALGSGFLAWPNGGPCIKAGHCTVLAATTPTQVTSAIINLFEASK